MRRMLFMRVQAGKNIPGTLAESRVGPTLVWVRLQRPGHKVHLRPEFGLTSQLFRSGNTYQARWSLGPRSEVVTPTKKCSGNTYQDAKW